VDLESAFGGPDLVGQGLIDPRLKDPKLKNSISTRIVNTPNIQEQIRTCPRNTRTCCYDGSVDLSAFGVSCTSPEKANELNEGKWRQLCSERPVSGQKQCGTRSYRDNAGKKFGDTSPGEFPWTCLLLNQDNDFVGTCALIPNDFSNNNERDTRKVITAAHKLKDLGPLE
jgi:hypothetical protein